MIRVLGIKRVLLLVVLVTVNVLFAGLVYGLLLPEKVKLQTGLSGLTRQISVVQQDISRLQVEFEQLEEQQSLFEELERDGFFRAQNRREAQDLFESIQNESRVISAVANISPGEIEDDEEAQKASYKILVSPIRLNIEALDDVDIYRYLYLIEKSFPGHITINSMQIERGKNLNAAVLRAVALGESPALISATINLSWRTMIAESQIRNLNRN